MAERIPQTRVTKNNNENRKKLKVRENPRYSKKHAIKIQQKKDRRMKMILSLFTIVIIGVLSSLTISKRSELVAKRDAYNELSNKTISTELKRDRLKAKLENSIDINRIQRYAIEELGMVYDKSSGEKIEFDGN